MSPTVFLSSFAAGASSLSARAFKDSGRGTGAAASDLPGAWPADASNASRRQTGTHKVGRSAIRSAAGSFKGRCLGCHAASMSPLITLGMHSTMRWPACSSSFCDCRLDGCDCCCAFLRLSDVLQGFGHLHCQRQGRICIAGVQSTNVHAKYFGGCGSRILKQAMVSLSSILGPNRIIRSAMARLYCAEQVQQDCIRVAHLAVHLVVHSCCRSPLQVCRSR